MAEFFLKSLVTEGVKKFPASYEAWKFNCNVQNSLPLDFIFKNINPLHIFKPYVLKTISL